MKRQRRQIKNNIQDLPYVTCPYCDRQSQFLHWQHLKSHDKTLQDVLQEFPNLPTMTEQESQLRSQRRQNCNDKVIQTNKERYGGTGFQCPDLAKKTKQTLKEKYGTDNIMKTEYGKECFRGDANPQKDPKTVEKMKRSLKKYYETNEQQTKGKTYEEILGPEKAAKRIKELRISGAEGHSLTPRISAPQLELYNLVKQLNPDAELEYPVDYYCLDIAIPDKKINIEYDGSYWHDKQRDQERDQYLSERGWVTYRFVDEIPTIEHLKTLI